MTDQQLPESESPKWGSTTKTVVGLAMVAMVAALVIYFRNVIAPLLLAFILSFLIHPIAAWISKTAHIRWRLAVNIIYLLLVLILIGTITVSGLAIIQQAQSLISFVDRFVRTVPEIVSNLSTQSYEFGPFRFSFSQFDLESITQQLLNIVQPVIGQAGTLLGRFATSAVTSLGWGVFVLVISYFLLSEGGQLRENLVHIEIPGYNQDVQILVRKLSATWDAFLRGQLIISIMVIVSYYLMLTLLGTRLSLVIALMAGLARFVPYVGPAITWLVTGIVAFFQTSNYFGLEPIYYTILVVGLCFLLDFIFDNMVVPRFMGQTLGLHPAAVLLAAIILARLIGLVGLVLAAPVLATFVLVSRYVSRKMFDLPPWPPGGEQLGPPPEPVWIRLKRLLEELRGNLRQRGSAKK